MIKTLILLSNFTEKSAKPLSRFSNSQIKRHDSVGVY